MSDLVKRLRSWKLIRFEDRTDALREAAGEIEQLQARIAEQGAAYEDLQSLCDKLTVENKQYEARIAELEAENKQLLTSCNETGALLDDCQARRNRDV